MADLTVACYSLGIAHPPGYPVYTWLGKAFCLLPLDGVAFRVGVLSSVCAAIALLLVFEIVVMEARIVSGGSRMAYLYGVLAVVLLGFVRPFWHYAQVAEVYALNVVSVLLFVFLFMIWQNHPRSYVVAAASLVLGLCLGTHLPNALIVPVFLVLVWLACRDLRLVGRSILLVLAGAAQYVYLILRAMQSPAYVNPQADFFEKLPWTGTGNPVYNWLWFITGGRWRGHYVRSGEAAGRKLREFHAAVSENYTVAALIILLAGTGLYVYYCRDRRKAAFLTVLVLIQAVYFIAYEWSSPGMILPLFALCSVLIALGMASLSNLASRILSRIQGALRSKRLIPCVFTAAVSAWMAVSSISRPSVDLSHLGVPSLWIGKMIASLPAGSKVDGIVWDYEKVIDYYRLVEGMSIPFQAGECDPAAIDSGRCYVLAVPQSLRKYQQANCELVPALYLDDKPIVYHVSRRPAEEGSEAGER